MNVLEAGTSGRPAVIFLHGLGTAARAWQPQMNALSDRYHVLALYHPGYGMTPGPFTIARAMQAIDDVFERYGLTRAHLCGLSLGTMVSLAYALRFPARVSSLSLCGGFARLTEEMRALTLASVPEIRGASNEEVRVGISGPVPEAYRLETLRDLGGVTGDHLATVTEQVAAFDVADQLPDLHIPTLVLCGERDEPNLPLSREIADLIPGARLELISEAGHVANLDNPRAFTNAVQRFLTEVEGG